MQRRITSQDITWFLDINSMGRLDLDPSYQRRSVWTRRDRQFFLDTIFNNYPSPAIFLHKDLDEYGNATYHVVDGKQRLETILEYVSNKLPVRDTFGDIRLDNKKWKDLSDQPDLKKVFLDYQITVEMIDSIEPTIVNEIFGRLNQNSRKLTPQEIRHARFDGWFISRAELEAEDPFWKKMKISTVGRVKRMQDSQYISELMAVTIGKTILGFDHDALNEIYVRYEFPEDLEPPFETDLFNSDFSTIRSYIEDLEEYKGCVTEYATNLAHFYSLWSNIAIRNVLPPVAKFSEAYSDFMKLVSLVGTDEDGKDQLPGNISDVRRGNVTQYAANAKGASTDLAPRLARQLALEAGMDWEEA